MSLYNGFGVSVQGIFCYRGAYFGLWDTAKGVIGDDMAKFLALKFLVAQLCVNTAGIVTYPFDTVRRRMMMQSGGKSVYKGQLDCWLTILGEEGVKGFFNGAFSNILRGVGGALVLVMYDEVQKQLQ